MKIRIPLSKHAYTPEAYAYREFLSDKGWQVQMDYDDSPDELALDLRLCLMGVRPLWKASRNDLPEVHEYQSLSVPPYAKAKNILKSYISHKPAGRIFLNEMVKNGFLFHDGVRSIYRDMGVDSPFFTSRAPNPEYDLIYCGSIDSRAGLCNELARLATLGLKTLVVGDVNSSTRSAFSGLKDVVFAGRIGRLELPGIYRNARLGLNFTPDIYPFNHQTSTKTLEYCAAGLGVVSNRYQWAMQLAKKRNARFLWLEDIKSRADVDAFHFQIPDVSDLKWSTLLEAAGLDEFLRGCAA